MRFGNPLPILEKRVQLTPLGKHLFLFPQQECFESWPQCRTTAFLARRPVAWPALKSLVFTASELDVSVAWVEGRHVPLLAWFSPEAHLGYLDNPWTGVEVAPEFIDTFASDFSKYGLSSINAKGALVHQPSPGSDVGYMRYLGFHVASDDVSVAIPHRVVRIGDGGDGYPFPISRFEEAWKCGVKAVSSSGHSESGLHLDRLVVTDPAVAKSFCEILGYCEAGARVKFYTRKEIGFDFCHSISISDAGRFAPLRGKVRIFNDRVRIDHSECTLCPECGPVSTWYGYDQLSGKNFVTAQWLADQILMNPENMRMKTFLGTWFDIDGHEFQHGNYTNVRPGSDSLVDEDIPF